MPVLFFFYRKTLPASSQLTLEYCDEQEEKVRQENGEFFLFHSSIAMILWVFYFQIQN